MHKDLGSFPYIIKSETKLKKMITARREPAVTSGFLSSIPLGHILPSHRSQFSTHPSLLTPLPDQASESQTSSHTTSPFKNTVTELSLGALPRALGGYRTLTKCSPLGDLISSFHELLQSVKVIPPVYP